MLTTTMQQSKDSRRPMTLMARAGDWAFEPRLSIGCARSTYYLVQPSRLISSLTPGNLFNIGRGSAVLLLVALAGTVVILIGSIDLSVAGTVTLTGVVCAFVIDFARASVGNRSGHSRRGNRGGREWSNCPASQDSKLSGDFGHALDHHRRRRGREQQRTGSILEPRSRTHRQRRSGGRPHSRHLASGRLGSGDFRSVPHACGALLLCNRRRRSRAAASGVQVFRYKVVAFVLSGAPAVSLALS